MIFRNFNLFLFDINNKFFKKIIIFTFIEIFTIVDIFKLFQFVDFLFKTNVVIFVKHTNLFNREIQLLKR